MSRLELAARLHDATMEELAGWYDRNRVPPALRAVDRRVLAKALYLAGGNVHRLSMDGDGTIIVWNHPVW